MSSAPASKTRPTKPLGCLGGEHDDRSVGPLPHGAFDEQSACFDWPPQATSRRLAGELWSTSPALLQPLDEFHQVDVLVARQRSTRRLPDRSPPSRATSALIVFAHQRPLWTSFAARTGLMPKRIVSIVTSDGRDCSAPA